jgi:hypothetical protein
LWTGATFDYAKRDRDRVHFYLQKMGLYSWQFDMEGVGAMGRSCSAHDSPQFDCIDCSRTANIRQAAADGRIELASTVQVDTLESYVEEVLEALGHPSALVTDLSTIGDFGLDDDERSTASTTLGVMLLDDDYIIYVVARRLRDRA